MNVERPLNFTFHPPPETFLSAHGGDEAARWKRQPPCSTRHGPSNKPAAHLFGRRPTRRRHAWPLAGALSCWIGFPARRFRYRFQPL